MKLKSLSKSIILNNEELNFILGGNSVTVSKKNDKKTDSNRTDSGRCIPPYNL
jgi:hypothetical protein